MTEASYLVFGFALFFVLLRKEGPRRLHASVRTLGWNFLFVALALGLLLLLHGLLQRFLWIPSGRVDLGLVSLFFWALLLDRGGERFLRREEKEEKIPLVVSPFFLILLSLGLSAAEKGDILLFPNQFLWVLALPLGAGMVEWLLEGLRGRLRLAHPPSLLEGAPLLFWMAMLLFLSLAGLIRLTEHL